MAPFGIPLVLGMTCINGRGATYPALVVVGG
jgi:hypothetical protein